jgi:hypothetical protein
MNNKNTKRNVPVQHERLSASELELSLGKLKAQVEKWITLYGADAMMNWDPYHYESYDPNPSPRYAISSDRLETDGEFKTRLEKEDAQRKTQLDRDKVEFERLSKIFPEKK